jgi:hypothetical protein
MVYSVNGIQDRLKLRSGRPFGQPEKGLTALFPSYGAVGLHGVNPPHSHPIPTSPYKRSFLKPSLGHWTSFRARD